MKADITKGLRSLSESLQRLKALLAWVELVQAERRPHQPPSFQINHDLESEIRNEHGYFIKTAMDIHEVLEKMPKQKRELLHRRLMKIEGQMQLLNLQRNLYKLPRVYTSSGVYA